jgi:putative ABC transport system permease protein
LLAAVGLLLLIACANVANLLLAKATTREKEFAVRASVGAERWHIVRQLMVESLLLGFSGAAVGCAFAWAGLKMLVIALPRFTFPDEAAISLNGRVLFATALIAIFTSLLFGLAPAAGSFAKNLSEPLKAGGRGNSGFRRGRLRNILISGEVALSLLLLAGAGLMLRSFLAQRNADLGFRLDHLMVSDVGLGKNYTSTAKQIRFAHDLTARLAAIPGVQSATAALDFAPFGGINTDFEVLGKTHRETWKGQMGFVDADFFSTIGMRLLRGRLLTKDDIEGKRKVAVINQTLARKYFPTEDPVGKHIELLGMARLPEPLANPWFEIVGVASDLRNHGVAEDVLPETYAPVSLTGVGEYLVYVRAVGNPAALAKAMDGAVINLDRSVHPNDTQSMEGLLDQYQYAKPRFALQIFAVFAVVGLVLVSVGVYSVVSYAVAQQTREIGIRMALGASSRNVLRHVLMGGMRFITAGVVIGIVSGLFLTRLMKSQLAGVSTNDPVTFASIAVLLVLVGLGACYLPSMRATRVDPLISLQCE